MSIKYFEEMKSLWEESLVPKKRVKKLCTEMENHHMRYRDLIACSTIPQLQFLIQIPTKQNKEYYLAIIFLLNILVLQEMFQFLHALIPKFHPRFPKHSLQKIASEEEKEMYIKFQEIEELFNFPVNRYKTLLAELIKLANHRELCFLSFITTCYLDMFFAQETDNDTKRDCKILIRSNYNNLDLASLINEPNGKFAIEHLKNKVFTPERFAQWGLLNFFQNLAPKFFQNIQQGEYLKILCEHLKTLIPEKVVIFSDTTLDGLTCMGGEIAINANIIRGKGELSKAKMVITLMHELIYAFRLKYE
mgnify:CR=1 FL=1